MKVNKKVLKDLNSENLSNVLLLVEIVINVILGRRRHPYDGPGGGGGC